MAQRGLTLAGTRTDPLWKPYPGSPQERALDSPASIIGYGGAAGGGKTDLILGAACLRHRNSIIFRREYPQLKGIVERSRELFDEHGRWNGQQMIWRLDDGRRIEMGAVQHETDKTKYRGRAHDLKAYDEATEIPESVFWFTMGWLRSSIPGQRCRALLTFNPPTSAAGMWVVRLFAAWLDRKHHNPALPGEIRWYARIDGEEVERSDGTPFEHDGETVIPMSRTFFPARLTDNPVYAATGYGATLQNLPEPLRSQLLYGDFDAGVDDDLWQVIPTKWIEAAMQRWHTARPEVRQTCLGVDVAHGGKDKTVIAARYGHYIGELQKFAGKETPNGASAAALAVKAVQPGAYVNVDVIGYGASAYERLAERPPAGHGIAAHPINFANRSEHTDRTGKYKMVNVRAEAYWRLREALDPEANNPLLLPPDPELLADLTANTYEITPGGIKIEDKAAITARIGHSPDCGDAVALTMIAPRPSSGPAIVGGKRDAAKLVIR
jgi:hypothetical protein